MPAAHITKPTISQGIGNLELLSVACSEFALLFAWAASTNVAFVL